MFSQFKIKINNLQIILPPKYHINYVFILLYIVPVTEQWRDELQHLTKTLGLDFEEVVPKKPQAPGATERPRTQYSETTGRIIPPPSRAMSRGRTVSRQGGDKYYGNLQHIAAEPDMETMVE